MTTPLRLSTLQLIEAATAHLGLSLSDGLQIMGGRALSQQNYPQIEATLPLFILLQDPNDVEHSMEESDQPEYLEALAGTLQACYPRDHILHYISMGDESAEEKCGLRQQSHPVSDLVVGTTESNADLIFVPSLASGSSFSSLLEIVAHLRAPDGCPWDREQTIATLRHDLLDEASELLEAIDSDLDSDGVSTGQNTAHIIEEMGDLLLLPSMMTQIAAEESRFQMADVTKGIVDKLVRRHPHVFGAVDTDDINQIVLNWDAIKAEEKASRGEAERGPLDGIPAALPALEKARKMQSKAQKANLLQRSEVAQTTNSKLDVFQKAANERTLGDLLWSIVALGHSKGINAENALRSYVVDFYNENG